MTIPEVYELDKIPTSCPKCGSRLKTIYNNMYFPTGANGRGIWAFREISLFSCSACVELFSVVGDIIFTNRIKIIDKELEDSDL